MIFVVLKSQTISYCAVTTELEVFWDFKTTKYDLFLALMKRLQQHIAVPGLVEDNLKFL